MANERPRIGWDADVLLSYIDEDEDRLPTIDELFRQSRAGEIELITSALSQAEVAFASSEAESQTLDPEIEEKIDELWTPSSPIQVVEFHSAIAQAARDLQRRVVANGKRGLRSHDAVHIATAQHMGAVEFQTYERKLDRYAVEARLTIREPATPQPQLPGGVG